MTPRPADPRCPPQRVLGGGAALLPACHRPQGREAPAGHGRQASTPTLHSCPAPPGRRGRGEEGRVHLPALWPSPVLLAWQGHSHWGHPGQPQERWGAPRGHSEPQAGKDTQEAPTGHTPEAHLHPHQPPPTPCPPKQTAATGAAWSRRHTHTLDPGSWTPAPVGTDLNTSPTGPTEDMCCRGTSTPVPRTQTGARAHTGLELWSSQEAGGAGTARLAQAAALTSSKISR